MAVIVTKNTSHRRSSTSRRMEKQKGIQPSARRASGAMRKCSALAGEGYSPSQRTNERTNEQGTSTSSSSTAWRWWIEYCRAYTRITSLPICCPREGSYHHALADYIKEKGGTTRTTKPHQYTKSRFPLPKQSFTLIKPINRINLL